MHITADLYDLPCFSGCSEASLMFAAGPIPPAAEKTSGVNEPCSISLMRSS